MERDEGSRGGSLYLLRLERPPQGEEPRRIREAREDLYLSSCRDPESLLGYAGAGLQAADRCSFCPGPGSRPGNEGLRLPLPDRVGRMAFMPDTSIQAQAGYQADPLRAHPSQ